jgi:CubicO group peptidase (beta-lactamase class C family)
MPTIRPKFRAIAAVVSLTFAFNLPTKAATGGAPPTDGIIAQRADEYLQAQTDAGFFSGTVLIACEGQTLFSKGYGYANAEWQMPNSVNTRFRLASITKIFTATLVLKMQELGSLQVHDAVAKYLDDCPVTWRDVTIHHLLTHTSGIPNLTDQPDFLNKARVPQSPAAIVATFRDRPLDFAAGEKYRYSNSGYFLLGLILEKISGKPYEQLLRELIFDPLGMHDTGYDRHSTVLPRRATGYQPDGEGLIHAEYIDSAWVYSAGGIYSTVEDMLKWDRALATNAILPSETLQLMWTADKGEYGYGWQVLPPSSKTFNRPLVMHAGGINGFATDYLRYPDENVSIVILSNLATSSMLKLSRDLSAIVFGESYSVPTVRKAIQVDPATYDTYAGEYQLSPTMSLKVTRENNRLMLQPTGQAKDVGIPESKTKFFSRRVDAQVSFVKDDSGKVSEMILHQGGREIRLPRQQP